MTAMCMWFLWTVPPREDHGLDRDPLADAAHIATNAGSRETEPVTHFESETPEEALCRG